MRHDKGKLVGWPWLTVPSRRTVPRGSCYDANPRWKQVAYERGAWDLHEVLIGLYHKQGGTQEEFNNTNVRLYKRDLRLFCAPLAEAILEHMKKGRVVYAESSF